MEKQKKKARQKWRKHVKSGKIYTLFEKFAILFVTIRPIKV